MSLDSHGKSLGGDRKEDAMLPLSCLQHQIGNYNVAPCYIPVDSPKELRHKDHTVYWSGHSQTLVRQENNHEKIKQHMILVKGWLSSLAFEPFLWDEGRWQERG